MWALGRTPSCASSPWRFAPALSTAWNRLPSSIFASISSSLILTHPSAFGEMSPVPRTRLDAFSVCSKSISFPFRICSLILMSALPVHLPGMPSHYSGQELNVFTTEFIAALACRKLSTNICWVHEGSLKGEDPTKNKPCPVLRKQVGFRRTILNNEDMVQGSPGSVSCFIQHWPPSAWHTARCRADVC